jgi:hypothetical protein
VRKKGRALCRKSSLYLAGLATLTLTREMTLAVARLPHCSQVTAPVAGWPLEQNTSVTAWHFLHRNSNIGMATRKFPCSRINISPAEHH